MADLNRLDVVLQQVCPTVMVPRYGALDPMTSDGHRFLVAENGLYLDLVRSWVKVRLMVGQSAIALPYGPIGEGTEFHLGEEFPLLLNRFVREARDVMPNEHAAWFALDRSEQRLIYVPVQVNWQNGAHINYQRPRLPVSHQLAVDIHSHGRHAAHFSHDDDNDDIDDAKLSIVVGSLHKAEFDVAARLVLPGGVALDYTSFISGFFGEQ